MSVATSLLQANAGGGLWQKLAPVAKAVIRPVPAFQAPQPGTAPAAAAAQSAPKGHSANSQNASSEANGAASGSASEDTATSGGSKRRSRRGGRRTNGAAAVAPAQQQHADIGAQHQGGAAGGLNPVQKALQGQHAAARQIERALQKHCSENDVSVRERVLVLDTPSYAPEWVINGEMPRGAHAGDCLTCLVTIAPPASLLAMLPKRCEFCSQVKFFLS